MCSQMQVRVCLVMVRQERLAKFAFVEYSEQNMHKIHCHAVLTHLFVFTLSKSNSYLLQQQLLKCSCH